MAMGGVGRLAARLRSACVCGCLGFLALSPAGALAADDGASAIAASQGTYMDAGGKPHPWSISAAHTLQWEGAAWIPTGLCFRPTSFATAPADPPADASAADAKTLDGLKAAGIDDLLLQMPSPAAGASAGASDAPQFSDVPSPAVQGLLDTLDKDGFRYGIDLHATLPGVSEGYSFGEAFAPGTETSPGLYTAPAPVGVSSALFVARDGAGAVIRMGLADLKDGSFEAAVPAAVSVYFVNIRHWGADQGVANLWDGFPECRDRVLTALHHLKPGAGLRFFVNPMDGPLAPTGRAAYFYPSSHHFRIEYEAWLRRKYGTIQVLCRRWGMPADALPDFETAARLIPNGSVRPDAVWDPEKDKVVSLAPASSSLWTDFEDFRMAAAQHDMNTLADSVRHNIADLPVLYRWQRFSQVYGSSLDLVGFDGLALNPSGVGDHAEREATFAYAQAADTTPSRWFMMYGGNEWTLGRLANLVDLGTKGFFLPATGPGMADEGTLDSIKALRLSIFGGGLPATPEVRRASVKPRVEAPVRSINYANYQPNILWFPWDLKVTNARRLSDGTWWLPTFRGGAPVPVGPDLESYAIADGKFLQIAVWSARGAQTVHLHLPLGTRVIWPLDLHLGHADREGIRAITLGGEPVVLEGIGVRDVFPVDAVEKSLSQADQLQKSLLIEQQNRQRLELNEVEAGHLKDAGLNFEAYVMINTPLDIEKRTLLPFIWIEGEKPVWNRFSGVARSSQCSGGEYLWLNNPDDPLLGKPYTASWDFTAAAPGVYDMWLGGTAPGQDWSSPIQWTLDNAPLEVQSHGPAGPAYGPSFHWAPLGEVNLSTGKHTLTATITGRRSQPDESYVFGIDAVAFSPGDILVRDYLKNNGMTPPPGMGKHPGRNGRRSGPPNPGPANPGEPDITLPNTQ